MDLTHLGFLAAGLVLLLLGAELLVRGAVRLAVALAVAPLIIGLTVVAYGTSAPELAVSLQAALSGRADLALGNVVGSNLFNVLFILGLSALIAPLAVSRQLVRLDVPLMVGISLLLYLMALDGRVGRGEGLVLVLLGLGYTALQVILGRRPGDGGTEGSEERGPPPGGGMGRSLLFVLAGLALLALGSRWLVAGASGLARTLGVGELLIGLTVVAAGTSLPEVATSVLASLRGQRDIAVGNVIGSNIFNIVWVLGMAAAVGGGVEVAPAALRFDVPVMLAAAVACLPIFFTGHVIARWEGGLFLGYYGAYMLFLVLTATGSGALPLFRLAMLGFALPLTAVTLAVVTARALRS